ncbi:MAG: hypothetical protein ACO3A4_14135 [Silvanigrellaceae bacterium]
MSNQIKLQNTSIIQKLSSSRYYFILAVIPSVITLLTAAAIVIYLGERDRRTNLFESQLLKTKYISSEVKERLVRQLLNPDRNARPVVESNPMSYGLVRFPEGSEVFVFATTPQNSGFSADSPLKKRYGLIFKSGNQILMSELPDDLSPGNNDNTHLVMNRASRISPAQISGMDRSTELEEIQAALSSKKSEGTFGREEKGSFKVISYREVEGTNIMVVTSQVLAEHFSYYKTPLLILLATFAVILALAVGMQKIIQIRFKRVKKSD